MSLQNKNSNNSPTGYPRFFDDFVSRDLFDWGFRNFSKPNSSLPSVNIIETRDAFKVEMAAPGMSKRDFNIELDNEVLRISADRESEKGNSDEHFVRKEYSYQSFQRTFILPKQVLDDARIEAKYRNGVLQIIIPKREEVKALPPRRIEIE